MSKILYRNEEVYKPTTITIEKENKNNSNSGVADSKNISSKNNLWLGASALEILCDAAIFVSVVALFVILVYINFAVG
nr:hypothetical protein IPEBKFLO_00068 [Cydia pomonella granulovirus]WOZ30484.1 hypothetical protein AGHAAFNI_00070 [Cydia pomonella granulovirus]WOZ30616.1 hypothetical protein KFGOHAPD_00074 [Cydia pomonella granulovirus]WOZ45255.1 hypothetical protein IFEMGEHL_00071 [Cydia pomonella granulovirus]WOZ45385.1 hypothetical protein JEDKAPMP_00073 [Cydia pomonella granulovirus]